MQWFGWCQASRVSFGAAVAADGLARKSDAAASVSQTARSANLSFLVSTRSNGRAKARLPLLGFRWGGRPSRRPSLDGFRADWPQPRWTRLPPSEGPSAASAVALAAANDSSSASSPVGQLVTKAPRRAPRRALPFELEEERAPLVVLSSSSSLAGETWDSLLVSLGNRFSCADCAEWRRGFQEGSNTSRRAKWRFGAARLPPARKSPNSRDWQRR